MTYVLSKKHLEQAFFYVIFFRSHPFNEMFTVKRKSHCMIAVMILLLASGLHRCQQRILKKNTNYFYALRINISLAILSEIFV